MVRAFRTAARIVAALALVQVAVYYLLASIPFTFYHFLQFPHFWWMPLFIRLHPLAMIGGAALLLATLPALPPRLAPWRRYLAVGSGACAAVMGAGVFAPQAVSYEVAAALTCVPLAVLLVASGLAIAAAAGRMRPPELEPRQTIGAAFVAAMLCGAIYFAKSAAAGATGALQRGEMIAAGIVSLAAHAALFVGTAIVAAAATALARRRMWPPAVQWLVVGACTTAALAVFIRRSLLSALILGDLRAALLSLIFAAALASMGLMLAVERHAAASRDVEGLGLSGVEGLGLSEVEGGWLLPAGQVLAVAAGVALLPRMLQLADWGSTIQKVIVVCVWLTAVSAAPTLLGRRRSTAALAVCAVVAALGTVAVGAQITHSGRAAERRPFDIAVAVDRYATFDMSLSTLFDIARPLVTDSDFYSALRASGERTADSSLPAVPLVAAGATERRGAESASLPDIFVIVVDSLRPDYLSAYNPSATFTPALGRFAEDSIVMRRAFAAYAGTALSEPSIWAGGLIPRAMYVKPFSAVNNLERLLDRGGYRRYISTDEILSLILQPSSDDVRLDAALAHPRRLDDAFKFDLCTTLGELEPLLGRHDGGRPMFFYTQPQTLHMRVLIGEEQYPRDERVRVGGQDFFAPTVRALKGIDACFGRFVDALKASGRYDKSVVVVTSDHGDAYGEAGRWGHAFYLAPETLRIPLLIHVPERMRADLAVDADRVALLTDLTPTLFDLLGYPPGPSPSTALLGRSLLRRQGDPPAPPPDGPFLVQSSYSHVYGLLDAQARWLYVADVNRAKEQFYDLAQMSAFPTSLPAADRVLYRRMLLERLARVGDFYQRPVH